MKPGCWNGEHHLVLPDHVADWDATSGWERARFAALQSNLRPTDTLWEIGAEHGSISAVLASWVASMVLVEPTPDFWGNIRATWEANGLPTPAACYSGLVGQDDPDDDRDGLSIGRWPEGSDIGEQGPGGYRYLHEPDHVAQVPRTTIDTLVLRTGLTPDVINIDVEGAERAVLAGARSTLRQHHPIVFVSVHPDLMERDYLTTPEELWADLAELGYEHHWMETDHEEHHALVHPEGRPFVTGSVV